MDGGDVICGDSGADSLYGGGDSDNLWGSKSGDFKDGDPTSYDYCDHNGTNNNCDDWLAGRPASCPSP